MRLVFAGTPEFAATVLRGLIESEHELVAVYTQPDRPAGRGRSLRASPVKRLAAEAGIEVRQPTSLRGAAPALAALTPHAMVVAAYGLILPRAVLEVPALGCINVHASLLPRWRGAAPIQRAILAGDAETGISIMQMDEGLDTGDVLLVRRTRIDDSDCAGTLHDRLAALGRDALLAVLSGLAGGSIEARPQDPAGATYAPRVEKREARLDWSRDARSLERAVRAFFPWPVAWTLLPAAPGESAGMRLRVLRAQAVSRPHRAVPGEILDAGADGIVVACGEEALALLQVQAPGRRVTAAGAFLNARPLTAGTRLE